MGGFNACKTLYIRPRTNLDQWTNMREATKPLNYRLVPYPKSVPPLLTPSHVMQVGEGVKGVTSRKSRGGSGLYYRRRNSNSNCNVAVPRNCIGGLSRTKIQWHRARVHCLFSSWRGYLSPTLSPTLSLSLSLSLSPFLYIYAGKRRWSKRASFYTWNSSFCCCSSNNFCFLVALLLPLPSTDAPVMELETEISNSVIAFCLSGT